MNYLNLDTLRHVEDNLIQAENEHRELVSKLKLAEHRLNEATERLDWARGQYFAFRDSVTLARSQDFAEDTKE